jgi:hypothetical protein
MRDGVGRDQLATICAGRRGAVVDPLLGALEHFEAIGGVDDMGADRPAEAGGDEPHTIDHREVLHLAAVDDEGGLLAVRQQPVGGALHDRLEQGRAVRVHEALRDVGRADRVVDQRGLQRLREPVDGDVLRERAADLLQRLLVASNGGDELVRRAAQLKVCRGRHQQPLQPPAPHREQT